MPIRILLVDDHSVVHQGLRMFLGLDPDIEVVAEASDGAERLRLARELPETEVLALTSALEDDKVVGAVRAGAIGYLLKDTRAEELVRAIKGTAAGQAQLSRAAARRPMREVRAPYADRARNRRPAPAGDRAVEQGDRAQPLDQREHRQEPRQQYPQQARRAAAHPGGAPYGADRPDTGGARKERLTTRRHRRTGVAGSEQ